MTVWAALILGLLMGWMVNRVIERDSWPERAQSGTLELEALRAQHSRLRADLSADACSLARIKIELAVLQADNERLRGELHAAHNLLSQYQIELRPLNTSHSTAPASRSSTV